MLDYQTASAPEPNVPRLAVADRVNVVTRSIGPSPQRQDEDDDRYELDVWRWEGGR